MANGDIVLNLWEVLKLKEIKMRHMSQKLNNADCMLSILKKVSTLLAETTIEELEETQTQLRAMINQAEKDMKVIDQDKEFVKNLMERAKIEPTP